MKKFLRWVRDNQKVISSVIGLAGAVVVGVFALTPYSIADLTNPDKLAMIIDNISQMSALGWVAFIFSTIGVIYAVFKDEWKTITSIINKWIGE